MIKLQVRRLTLKSKLNPSHEFKSAEIERVDKICTDVLKTLHSSGLHFITGYSQRALRADVYLHSEAVSEPREAWVDANAIEKHYKHSRQLYLMFTPYNVGISYNPPRVKSPFISSYKCDGVGLYDLAIVSTSKLDSNLQQAGNDYFVPLHELGHAVYKLHHHMDAYGDCVMGIGTKGFCDYCIEKAKALEEILPLFHAKPLVGKLANK